MDNTPYAHFTFDGQSTSQPSIQQQQETAQEEEYEDPTTVTGTPYTGRAQQFLGGMKSGTFRTPNIRDHGFKDVGPAQKSQAFMQVDPFYKQKLIFKLLRWKKAFPEELEHLIPEIATLSKMDLETLENMFNEARYMVALVNSTALEQSTSAKSFLKLENFLSQHTAIQADGMTMALMGNVPFQKSLKEWTLENTEIFYSDPKWRTMLLGGLTLYEVHTRNLIIQQQKQFMNQPIKGTNGERMDNELQDILEDFADLSEMVENQTNNHNNNDENEEDNENFILGF